MEDRGFKFLPGALDAAAQAALVAEVLAAVPVMAKADPERPGAYGAVS